MKHVSGKLKCPFFRVWVYAASDPAAGWGGGKKHEIYVATFGGHLFYDLFVQGWGEGHGPLGTPPGSATVMTLTTVQRKAELV